MVVILGLRVFVSLWASASPTATSTAASPSAIAARTSSAAPAAFGSESEPSLSDQLDAVSGGAAKPGAPMPSPSPFARAFQSLNPDIAVILDFTAGYGERAPIRLAGDDPDLKGGAADHSAGFTLQEAELALQSVVDPYFRGDVFLTIANLSPIEVEEAFITTTALPADLQLKAGVFRSALGRQNGQHLHIQDFTRRPLLNSAYLGTDGLRAPGAQLSWLAPLPVFVQLNVEAFSVSRPDDLAQLSTFGGGSRTDLTYALELKVFAPATESLAISAGLNWALGRSAGVTTPPGTPPDAMPMPAMYLNSRTRLYGADLYVKFKPPNQANTYFSLAWTTEYFYRELLFGGQTLTDGGMYSQIVVQLARQWFVGIRQDVLGVPASNAQPRILRTAGSITLAVSEFARVRAFFEHEIGSEGGMLSPKDNNAAYLQLEVSLGAHGAHPY